MPGAGTCNVAPLHNAISTSKMHASKLNDANSRTRLCGVTAKCSICASAKLHSPAWATIAPFGRPVEPEV
jgi:hypothetical protein